MVTWKQGYRDSGIQQYGIVDTVFWNMGYSIFKNRIQYK